MNHEIVTEETMEPKDNKNILKILDESGVFSRIEDMTVREIREYLKEKGFLDLSDILAIAYLVFEFLTGERIMILGKTDVNMELREIRFAYKYGLTKKEAQTLKLMAQGLKYREIARSLEVSVSEDAVAKTVRRIFDKLGVHNRTEASRMAFKEGLI